LVVILIMTTHKIMSKLPVFADIYNDIFAAVFKTYRIKIFLSWRQLPWRAVFRNRICNILLYNHMQLICLIFFCIQVFIPVHTHHVMELMYSYSLRTYRESCSACIAAFFFPQELREKAMSVVSVIPT
jgi:hypothetical protein